MHRVRHLVVTLLRSGPKAQNFSTVSKQASATSKKEKRVSVVMALGGNALLRRGEPLTAENQRRNMQDAAEALAQVAYFYNAVITHGNGPQVGLLALQNAALAHKVPPYPLDILGSMTQGMIGYVIQQELSNKLPNKRIASLLTQVVVSSSDPAFKNPTKPIGPAYDSKEEIGAIAQRFNWSIGTERDAVSGRIYYRRVVASPKPQHIVEIPLIRMLMNAGVLVICGGGGGIPVVKDEITGAHTGVEVVVDKDLTAARLAEELKVDALVILTDVNGVYSDFGTPHQRVVRIASTEDMRKMSLPAGSMGPKVEAACQYVEATGGWAAIGSLKDAAAIMRGDAGTRIVKTQSEIVYYPEDFFTVKKF